MRTSQRVFGCRAGVVPTKRGEAGHLALDLEPALDQRVRPVNLVDTLERAGASLLCVSAWALAFLRCRQDSLHDPGKETVARAA